MQGNRSRDTSPELRLRRVLHGRGLRYRVCARPLPHLRRSVDVVFRPSKVAVEVRGCFWHGCPEHYRAPAANSDYWAQKVARNRARDLDTGQRLAAEGWILLAFWEHDDPRLAAEQVAELVAARRPAGCQPSQFVAGSA